jgi:hypothetical protein
VTAHLAHGIEDLRARVPAIGHPVADTQVGVLKTRGAGGDLLGVGVHARVVLRQRVCWRRLHGIKRERTAALGGH